jgi:hypothetical protein
MRNVSRRQLIVEAATAAQENDLGPMLCARIPSEGNLESLVEFLPRPRQLVLLGSGTADNIVGNTAVVSSRPGQTAIELTVANS